jgi:hypothetical protein
MRKVSKKAIFGMLVAMVMSLGVIGGINKSSSKSTTLQQYTVASFYCANQSESTLGQAVGKTLGATFGGVSFSLFSSVFIIGGPAALILGITWGTVTAA